MKLTAAVKTRDTTTGEIVPEGHIIFDGEKVVASEPSLMLTRIAAEPIMAEGGGAIYPEDEPERFVRNLHLNYRGSYAWADEAQEYFGQ